MVKAFNNNDYKIAAFLAIRIVSIYNKMPDSETIYMDDHTTAQTTIAIDMILKIAEIAMKA